MATGDDVLRKNRGLGMLLASMGNNKDKATNKTGIPKGDVVLRKNRGLGMLVASLGNNKDKDTNKTGIPKVTKRIQDEFQGFDPVSSGFSGWDDISSSQNTVAAADNSKMATQRSKSEETKQAFEKVQDHQTSDVQGFCNASWNPKADTTTGSSQMHSEQNNSEKGKSGNSSAGVQKEKTTSGTQKQKYEGRNKRKLEEEMRRFEESVSEPSNISSWAAMKEYDDDHDRKWFEDENARLAELYGGSFIYAKYMDSQPGKVGYYCELCFAEMNARKSLDLHCSGMKHLKKKSMWEKGHGHDGEGGDGSSERVSRLPPRQPRPYGWPNRGPPVLDSSRGPRHPVKHSPYREPRSPERRNDDIGHFNRWDDYGGYHSDNYQDYHRREQGPYRPPFQDSYNRRNSPPGRDRENRGWLSRERFSPYSRCEAPPPPVISGSPRFHDGKMQPRDGSSGPLFEGIADGSCCELLKRLAACRVRNEDDSALALNVANFLMMSLKDYYNTSDPSSVTYILQEIVIKIGIVKDLLKCDDPLHPS